MIRRVVVALALWVAARADATVCAWVNLTDSSDDNA